MKRFLVLAAASAAMAAALAIGGCTDSNCPGLDAGFDENIQPSSLKLAQHIALALPAGIADRAQAQVDELLQTRLQSIVDARSKAEAAYQAAKERKERPAPLPRPKLDIDKKLIATLPPFRHESLIAELYGVETPNRRQFFIQNKKLTPAANALLDTLQLVDMHALNVNEFAPETLRQLAQKVDKMQDILADPQRHQLNVHEIRALAKALENGLNVGGQTIAPDAFAAMDEEKQLETALAALCSFETTPIPRVAANCERERENIAERVALADALEFALADAWLAYAEQMKYGNLEKFSNEELEKYTTPDNPNEVHPKHHAKIIEERLAVATEALFRNPAANAVSQILDDLVPKHEQYARLQQARDRYRTIVDNGGWQVVPPDRMFAGGHAPLVKSLKTRLSVEGYYEGDIDDSFDRTLTEAIRKYQLHHQLDETGAVDEVFWRSLNVKAEQRLAEIEVNIRRWHKTLFEPRETYIYINIPSFSVEFWADGKHISTHRAVVGSSTRICNTRTQEWELMNSTRLMHSRMTYLVYNPFWNVPPRIEVDEFWPKINADPKWLATTDYEYFTPKGGGRVLRQKPGENNALGRVKLIFPNRYNIYLHDTPKQGMFNYPVRAFSHGCIRVEGATKLAKAILEHDGQYDKKAVDRFLKSQTEHPIDLKSPIDVFIEYHTVTVDDAGEPYFLADIYKIIKNEIDPPTALERRCNPSTDRTSSYRSGAGEDSGP